MNDQLIARREKMDEMRENGIEPFGVRKFDRQDLARTLNEKYSNCLLYTSPSPRD